MNDKSTAHRGRIRVLIVDDHEVVRLGLVTLLSQTATIEVVATTGTTAGAIAEARRVSPDVVLMDLRLPDGNGLDACLEIRAECPSTQVLFLTAYFNEAAATATLLGRGSGYLFKDVRRDDLVRAIEGVVEGQSFLDPRITRDALARMRRAAESPDTLSPQERRVLVLVAEGKTNKEIADALQLSDKTVRNYLSNTFQKLHVKRRAQAAALFGHRSNDPLDD